jgi:alkylation response protein AidB-like acyl-CoA dehydrogenase
MDDDELRTAACILKSHASVVGTNVCELALQVHGGIGFTAEYELHLFFKRSLTLSTYLGAPPELNTAVGRRALGGATPW